MSEPRKSRLPFPLGRALESRLPPEREERLWARIRMRRSGLGGHSEPPQAGMYLPAPLARVLDDADDLTNKRSRVWRSIQARRKSARSAAVFRGAFALGFGAAALASLLLLWRPEFIGAPGLEARRGEPAGVLMQADGRHVATWEARGADRVIELADRSRIRLAPGARIEPLLSSGSRFELLLTRGTADFSVTPGGPRRWVVDAGLAHVEVVGTEFRVARESAGVRVTVAHGIVLVRGPSVPGQVQRLTAGQTLEVTPQPVVTQVQVDGAAVEPGAEPGEAAVALPQVELSAMPSRRAAGAASRARPSSEALWKTHVSEGRFAEAYAALGPARFKQEIVAAQSVEALLSLADAARLSGHPGDAVAPLERVLGDFAASPHAALAAFTLGRVQLDQLRAPDEAARAFERAILMHPPSAILADCHARLVEAYARAGDTAAAQRAAARYRTLFPAGRHDVDVDAWKKRP